MLLRSFSNFRYFSKNGIGCVQNNFSLIFNQVHCKSCNLQCYSSSRDGRFDLSFPKFSNLPEIYWPSLFKSFTNVIYTYFIIKPYFDVEFDINDFEKGSRKALEVISTCLSNGDFDSLNGLLTPDLLDQIKQKVPLLSLTQRQQMVVMTDDVYFSFPYQIGIIFNDDDSGKIDKNDQQRFVEITMCFHSIFGLGKLRQQKSFEENFPNSKQFENKVFIINCRFIKEFTKGVSSSWTVNALNYLKPLTR